MTSSSGSVLCLERTAHSGFLSDTTNSSSVTSKSVCPKTVSDIGSGPEATRVTLYTDLPQALKLELLIGVGSQKKDLNFCVHGALVSGLYGDVLTWIQNRKDYPLLQLEETTLHPHALAC